MSKTICAGGFIYKGGRFLLGCRSMTKSWAPGLWDIVGGHAKKQEPLLETLKRETLEELGIIVEDASLMTVIEVPDDSKSGYFRYHIYWINRYSGEPINCSDEHSEIRWFSRAELETLPLADASYLNLIDDWLSTRNINDITL